MPLKLFMPALSPTMEEGNLTKWLIKEGDVIKSGDVIAEIETDKATMEFESIDDGVLGKILIPSGTENVRVNTVIAIVLIDGETEEDLIDHNNDLDKDTLETKSVDEDIINDSISPIDFDEENKASNLTDVKESKNLQIETANIKKTHQGKVIISPLAKRLAAEGNIDYSNIIGSGPNGRIVKRDIESSSIVLNNHIDRTKSNEFIPNNTKDYYITGKYDVVQLTKMREIISNRLTKTISEIPQYSLNIDCSVSNLNETRKRINREKIQDGVKLSINDFIIKASSKCLLEVPEVNSSWAGDCILKHHSSDIGFAVAVEGGLITPIIRNVNIKGLKEISLESKELIIKAKERKLSPTEYEGGNFSISNLGSYGIKSFNSIINQPQSSILSIGIAEDRPVVIDGALAIDMIMTVTMTSDHRVIDGAVAAKFISYFKKLIEDPSLLLL
ncbi:MAG: pyruvate dehydrogenase complex dihydrolipoamide acetyltransferase [Alphaproteobacteria bacterium]|jgi:pyruvate dehydrogenase E2 component (dihydrolipoamide acetyltransferase)|tara:strand:+ start:20542 stop:21876 length:1335 start_codon:yes stop_codon:yes gene_type:complete